MSPPARALPVKGSLRRHRGAGSERGAAHSAAQWARHSTGDPAAAPPARASVGGAGRRGGGRGARRPAAGLPLPASPASRRPRGVAPLQPRPWRPERSHPAHGAAVGPRRFGPFPTRLKPPRAGERLRPARLPAGGGGEPGLREAKRGQPPQGPRRPGDSPRTRGPQAA